MDWFKRLFTQFVEDYRKVFELLKRIGDAPLETTGQLVFDRYEGAYLFGTYNDDILKLFAVMQRVGNILAMALMLDVAAANRRITRTHIVGYLKGLDLNLQCTKSFADVLGSNSNVVEELFNQQNPIMTDEDVYPPLFSRLLSTIIRVVTIDQKDLFREKSTTILDLPSLTGFGARWSVLEFIFLLLESLRVIGQPSPFELYGEGVMMCASAVIQSLGHERLSFATNIGRRLQRLRSVDYTTTKDQRFHRFYIAEEFQRSCLQWAFSIMRPVVSHLKTTGLLE
jgi:hypothetical protein